MTKTNGYKGGSSNCMPAYALHYGLHIHYAQEGKLRAFVKPFNLILVDWNHRLTEFA